MAVVLSPGRAAAADDSTDRYFDALLDRGLVRVAENEALRRLDDSFLKPSERVEWTVRLARAHVRHAALIGPAEREALIERGRQRMRELATAVPALPQPEFIAAQQVFLAADIADLRRAEWEAAAPDERLRGAAAAVHQEVLAELRRLQERLEEDVRRAASRTPAQLADGELAAADVRRLQRDAEQRVASLLVGLVEASPDGVERTTAMQEADRRLQPLAQGWIGDPRTWEAKLLRIRLARARGDHAQASGIARSALKDQPAQWLVDRITAELVRTYIEGGQLDAALAALLEHGRTQGRLTDELMYLQVDALLRSRRLAEERRDERTAEELGLRAEAWIGQMHGAWADRARLRLDREREAGRYGPEIAGLLQQARGAFHAGETDRANDLFAAAARRSVELRQPLAADEFDYTRGSILLQAGRFDEAAGIFEALIGRSPVGPHTQDADLLRAYALGRGYQQEATRVRREQYAAALQRHRERYPGTPSAVEATWMLAAFEEGRQQWTLALPLYLEIVDDSTRGGEARLRAAVLYETILDRLRELQQPLESWEDQAVEELAAIVRRFPGPAVEWDLTQTEISLRLVRIVLSHREHPYAEADRLLTLVLQAAEQQRRAAEQDGRSLDEGWLRLLQLARQLRIVSLAGQGRIDEARQLFDSLAVTEPSTLLGLLQGLSRLAAQIPEARRAALAHLQLETAQRLRDQRGELTDEQRRVLDECRADAYLAAGNLVDAIAVYETLFAGVSGDLSRTRLLAELLQRQGTPVSLGKAKSYWRRVERAEKPGSDGWLEARLQIATCAARSGEIEEARKLIGVTRLVYPELGGEQRRRQIEQLERELPR